MSIKSIVLYPYKMIKNKIKFRRIHGVDIRTSEVSDDLSVEEFVRIPRKSAFQTMLRLEDALT